MKDDRLIQRPAAATRLVLLFHGVGASAEDLLPLGQALAARQPQAWVVSVRSPDPCDLRRVHLRLQAQSALFGFDDGTTVELPIGPQSLTGHALRHDPPTAAAELERAIDLVEDALARWPGALPAGGELVTDDPLLRALPGLGETGSTLGREAVEALFQRLASRALGTPISEAELPNDRAIAAALLMLRECMHHLGFERVVVRPD